MTSPSQRSIHEALEAFSQGDVERADTVLEAAAQEGLAKANVDDALSLCCMRASIAAMEGSMNVARFMSAAVSTPQGVAATCYLEGLAALARNSLQTARMKFDEALRRDETFKLANLGLAAVSLQEKEYKVSFAQYREVLSKLGSEACPPIARVGMGLCAYYLNNINEAQKFLERAAEVNPEDELALFGLLVVYIDRRLMSKVTEVVSQLRRRLPHNATVLLKVTDLMYFKALGSKRVKAALHPIKRILSEVRAFGAQEECAMADYQEGRLLLVSGDLVGAQPLLESALRTFPTLLAARVHYARLLHYSGKTSEALQLLRKIDEDHPNQKEVLQLLALYATRSGHHETALKYCRLLTDTVAQGDLRSWSLAAWCSRLNAKESEKLLAQMVSIHNELKVAPPWQLLANVAVVQKDTEALQAIVDRELGGDFEQKSAFPLKYIPLVFNLALLSESDNAPRARQLYMFLVKKHCSFPLPYLRLHELAIRDGMKTQAVAWLTLLSQVMPKEPSAQTGIAQLFFKDKRYTAAVDVLNGVKSRSIPAALAKASTYLWCCQHSAKHYGDHLKMAKDRFLFVLQHDKDNILAAHGLACCLALERKGDEAQSLFNRVGEVTPNCSYVSENHDLHMANLKTLSERYKQAIDYFQKVSPRTPQQESTLAFCYACSGDHEAAIETLKKAVERSSEEESRDSSNGGSATRASAGHGKTDMLKYNLAVICCAAFLHRVSAHRSLNSEEGRELNRLLERGLNTAFQFIEQRVTTRLRRQSAFFLKSLCNYALTVHDTVFKQLLVTGVESRVEQEREAERWRETFAAFRAEMDRDEEQRRLQEAREKAERAEGGRRVLEGFAERRRDDPVEYVDQDIVAARLAELLAAEQNDLIDIEQPMENEAALVDADRVGDDGVRESLGDPNDFAG